MNVVILMGRLTKDPEVRYAGGENRIAIASYSLAVDRRFKSDGQPEADFFNCVCFGKRAEFADKYLKKGMKILIQGELHNNNYQGKDGKMVYRNEVVVERQQFCESKKVQDDGYMPIPKDIDEEIPF